jgi:hypothetical protein
MEHLLGLELFGKLDGQRPTAFGWVDLTIKVIKLMRVDVGTIDIFHGFLLKIKILLPRATRLTHIQQLAIRFLMGNLIDLLEIYLLEERTLHLNKQLFFLHINILSS